MKRILGFLMALMICLGVFTVVGGVNTVYAADIASGTYDGVSWKITEDGELILGNGGLKTTATYQQDENLNRQVKTLQKIDIELKRRENEEVIVVKGTELLGELSFSIKED